MGRYLRKCRGIGELSVVEEVSEVAGGRTRAKTLAMAAAAAAEATEGASLKRRRVDDGEFQICSYLQPRSRRLVVTPEKKERMSLPLMPPVRRNSSGQDQLSRCSSNASSELVGKDSYGSGYLRVEGLETEADYSDCHRERSKRKEWTPSSELPDLDSDDLESAARQSEPNARPAERTASPMPSEAEIEDFFTAAERAETKRFADRYNYDVVKDVPLRGRFEWVRLEP